MLRQLIRARKPIITPARIHAQTRSLHSPFVVLSGSNPSLASESQSKNTTASAAAYQHSESKPDTYSYEAGTTVVEETVLEDEVTSPRVHVVSEPDPNLGAPFGVRLGAYPVSEPFA